MCYKFNVVSNMFYSHGKGPVMSYCLLTFVVHNCALVFSTLMMGQTVVPKRWFLNINQMPGNHP
jgi:hypothetical protein